MKKLLSLLLLFTIALFANTNTKETCYSVQLLAMKNTQSNVELLTNNNYDSSCKTMQIGKKVTVRCGCYKTKREVKIKLSELKPNYSNAYAVSTYAYRFGGVQTLSSDISQRSLKRVKQVPTEARVALIIGNNNYQSRTLTKLNNPINDAQAIKDVLSQRDFEIIYAEDATRKIMNKKLKLFYQKLRNGAVGFLYYSGHGLEIEGENYLIPIDASIEDKDDVDNDSIAVDGILKKMQRSGNRLNIAVLDACRNDPFSKGGSGGLAKVEPEGIFVAYATSAGKVASDGRRGTNGLFTKHLIKYMKQDGLALYDVFKKTRAGVYIESGKKQRPAIYDQVIGEEFFFTLPTKAPLKDRVKKEETTYNFNTTKPKTYSLTIQTVPSNATISIPNISYHQGIKLEKGNYKVTVSKEGYLPKEGDINLKSDSSIVVKLEKKIVKVVQKVVVPKKVEKVEQVVKQKRKILPKVWKDSETGLIWQVKIDKKKYNWDDAKSYCQNLTLDGKSDWKLPNREELTSIRTENSYINSVSCIEKTYIKKPLLESMDMEYQWFWSATEYDDGSWFGSSKAWFVNFTGGGGNYLDKSFGSYVRCVVGK